MNYWLKNLKAALSKQALDKLPESELNAPMGINQSNTSAASPAGGGANAAPTGCASPIGCVDPSMLAALSGGSPAGGAPTGMPGCMGGCTVPPPQPLVWNNKYLVKTDGPEFIVELTPSIVNIDPNAAMPPVSPTPSTPAPQNPMDDKSLNPNADSQKLEEWLEQQKNQFKEVPNQSEEKAPQDPLSKQEEGLPIEDEGNEKDLPIKVHQKAASFNKFAEDAAPDTGIDRSNAYYPCAVCTNYNAKDGTCSKGLDVEKVQAAKSCSWLNSNFHAFGEPRDTTSSLPDKEIYKSDVSDLGGGSNAQGPIKAASKGELKDKLRKLW
jgi:hypothetical protein